MQTAGRLHLRLLLVVPDLDLRRPVASSHGNGRDAVALHVFVVASGKGVRVAECLERPQFELGALIGPAGEEGVDGLGSSPTIRNGFNDDPRAKGDVPSGKDIISAGL